ncbi:MAG TPA: sulfur oxidation c-type cytochrome SoxX [Burkholderiales bacterium]|nr:sulfur oxidation c-type cytochrome SoxX [Burkholderiales bacterium]
MGIANKAVPLALLALAAASTAAEEPLTAYRVENGAIVTPLAARGDPGRGKEIVLSRESNCVLCHAVPDSGLQTMGNLGPPLAGAAARLSEGQLRLRVVDSLRLNPDTVMPSYYRVDGLTAVAAQYRGKPVLTAQQVEDVIAYLLTLR